MSALKQPKTSSPSFQLSLRIRHSSIDPQEISDILKLDPDHSFKAGSTYRSQAGSERVRAETYWLASIDEEAAMATLETWKKLGEERTQAQLMAKFDMLGNIIGSMGGYRTAAAGAAALKSFGISFAVLVGRLNASSAFLHRLRAEGGSVTILIQLSPEAGSFSLEPALAKLLGEWGVGLEVDCISEA